MTARPPFLKLWLDGVAVESLAGSVLALEVEERADEASSARIVLDLSPIGDGNSAGDWDALEYGPFAAERGVPAFRLLSRVCVTLGFEAADDDPAVSATVFDGYVTAVEPVIGRNRVPDSYLVLSCLDATCLMHLETVTRTWEGLTDAKIAGEIFGKYGFASTPGDTIEDGGVSRDAILPGLVQRGTDAEFLRMLARRNGFEWYVEPAGEVHAGHPPRPGRRRALPLAARRHRAAARARSLPAAHADAAVVPGPVRQPPADPGTQLAHRRAQSGPAVRRPGGDRPRADGHALASRRARRAAGRDPAGEGRRGDRGTAVGCRQPAGDPRHRLGERAELLGRARQPGPRHAAGRRLVRHGHRHGAERPLPGRGPAAATRHGLRSRAPARRAAGTCRASATGGASTPRTRSASSGSGATRPT